MNQAASPRHPFKALAVVLATFALVHGACAHVFTHDHDVSRIHVHHAAQVDEDEDDDGPDVDIHVGPDADAHFGPNFPFDDDDTPARDPVDHDWD
jgi:hypothetical protein